MDFQKDLAPVSLSAITWSSIKSSTFSHVQAVPVTVQAAELFEVENQGSEANKCRLKIAQFSAELERFPVAIEIYESIAKAQVDNNLLKFSAKGNLLNAGLCRLNGKASSVAEGVVASEMGGRGVGSGV